MSHNDLSGAPAPETAPATLPAGSATLAHRVGDMILERNGQDLVVLDVEDITSLCDYLVVVTATSARHARTMIEELRAMAKADGHVILGVEGMDNAQWCILDLADVVVHIMQEETRAHFELELLWEDGRVVRRAAEVA